MARFDENQKIAVRVNDEFIQWGSGLSNVNSVKLELWHVQAIR